MTAAPLGNISLLNPKPLTLVAPIHPFTVGRMLAILMVSS